MAKTFIPYKGPRIIPNCVDVTVNMLAGPNHIMNKFQFMYASTVVPTAAQLAQLCAEWGAAYATATGPQINTIVEYVDVRAVDIGRTGGATAVSNYTPGTHGASTGGAEPMNVAASIALLTGKAGRRYRGRKSLSGFSEDRVNGNTLGTEIMSMLLNLGAALLIPRVGSIFNAAVGSLPKVTAAGPPQVIGSPAVATRLTGISTVDTNVDSQKTRLNNRGS